MDGVFDGSKVQSGRRGYDLEVGYKLYYVVSILTGVCKCMVLVVMAM